MGIRRLSCLAALLLVIPLAALASPPAAGPQPAHYIVFELDDAGDPQPVFYRRVVLAESPSSLSAEQLLSARSRAHSDQDFLTIELASRDGRVLHRTVADLAPAIRAEHHGEATDHGGWEIESTPVPDDGQRAFVVRVPAGAGDTLVLEGTTRAGTTRRVATRATFELEGLSRQADQLPLAFAAELGTPAHLKSGSPANRVDLLVMGDGYTTASSFDTDAANLIADFFNISPYAEYQNYVNVSTLYTPSAQAGADHPPYDPTCSGDNRSCCSAPQAQTDPLAGTYVDTAFNGRFCAFQTYRLAVVDNGLAFAVASAVPDWDHLLMLLNDSTYGGSGGAIPVSSTHSLAVDIARHEYGHSFTDLADEYDTAGSSSITCSDIAVPPSCEANVTDQTERALIKWLPWIDPATPIPTPEQSTWGAEVGLFEGARYRETGMYRPRDTECLMNFLAKPFCEVCRQEYVLQLYRGGWGIPAGGIDPIEPGSESPAPGTVSTTGPVTFSVAVLSPSVGPSTQVSWWVNGVQQAGATGTSFVFSPTVSGTYQVEVRAKDPTTFVKPAMAGTTLDSSRSWTVLATITPPLGTPQNVAASDGTYDDRVRVTFQPVSGATYYRIYRHTTNNAGQAIQIPAFVESGLFDDRTAIPGVFYYYWVQAVNDVTESALSTSNRGHRRNDGQQEISGTTFADAWVNQLAPSTNYGSATDLRVRGAEAGSGHSTYLKFTVPFFQGVYQTAKLRIRTQSNDFSGSRVYGITSVGWNESTITWNNAPLTFSTTYATGELAGNAWHEIDVTPLISGAGTYTIGLVAPDEPGMAFWSRESGNAASLVVTYQPPVTATFATVADAWTNQLAPFTNYGSDTGLDVRSAATGQGRHAYLKFTVSGISGPVQSARLRIRTQGVTIPSARIYRIATTSWSESTLNWSNGPLNWLVQYPLGTLAANRWHTIDVSAIVIGPGTYTIALVAADAPNLAFWSRESAYPPTLEVTYQP